MPYKVYYLYSTENENDIRYIGQTYRSLNTRLNEHLYNALKKKLASYLHNWIVSVKERGFEVKIELLVDNAIKDITEIDEIRKHREMGCHLVNLTNGGDFGFNSSLNGFVEAWGEIEGTKRYNERMQKIRIANLGSKRTPETKKLMSERQKGNKKALGKKWSEEHKNKIRVALMGNKNGLGKPPWNRGKVGAFSKETIEKMSEAQKKTYQDGRVAWNKGKTDCYSQETIEKLKKRMIGNKYAVGAKGNLGRKFTEEHRQKLREAKLGGKLTEEHKQKIGQAGLGRVPWNKGLKFKKQKRRVS